ncbi:hypothetical protein [Pseudoalteromonas byunsanensis]|uniref:Uncharacterized protein n=1 Tax=Pseudoalteromonas byunsanensis TaxID=327939 RepID=A0A1S1N9K6_9GAMM|nr:hypothetical protein [Pseudoalteromonas byunsanensis]OHU96689.1 hypothetical protein BIW53_05010 [Pseudoalteromonas byunsanensis]
MTGEVPILGDASIITQPTNIKAHKQKDELGIVTPESLADFMSNKEPSEMAFEFTDSNHLKIEFGTGKTSSCTRIE